MRVRSSTDATRRTFLLGAAAAALSVAAGCGLENTSVAETSTPLRISYGNDPDNFGDLYLPDADTVGLPVLVMIHGGGWEEKYDLTYTGKLAQTLMSERIAVWNIEYRRVGGSGGWPTTLADADAATEALGTVVQERVEGRLDLNRVHIAGHSAGGHLAAWVASRHKLDSGAPGADPQIKLNSATIMAGVLDLEMAATAGKDQFVRDLLGGTPQEQPVRYRIASPIDHLPIGLPVTAFHGDRDNVVSPNQSRKYVEAALEAGDPAVLRVLPGVGHGEFGDPKSSAWAAARAHLLEVM